MSLVEETYMRYGASIIFTLWITTSYAQEGRVCVYEHPNYRGWERCFTESQKNFNYLGINDEISSVQIFGDIQVKLYQNAHYQGMGRLYTENTPWVGDEVNDQFSSLQIISSVQEQVCLYEHPHYQGIERCFTEDQANFAPLGINDQVSSLRISGPLEVNLFQHAHYRGFRRVYTESVPWVEKEVEEQFSSLQILHNSPSKSVWRKDSQRRERNASGRDYNEGWIKPPSPKDGDERDRHHKPGRKDTHQYPGAEERQNEGGYKRLPRERSDANPQQSGQNYFRLRIRDKCLTVTHRYENATSVQAWPCELIATQLWKWEQGRLIHYDGKCLDADSGSMNRNGGKVQVWECHHRTNQQWSFHQGRLMNQGSGKCLDLHEGDFYNPSGQIQLWDCHHRANQQWDRTYR